MMAEADIKSNASEASDLSSLSDGHSAHLPRQDDKEICKGRRARAKGALTRFMNSVDILLANPENLTAIKQKLLSYQKVNKSTLDNSPPPLLNFKSLLRPQGQIIVVKCELSE